MPLPIARVTPDPIDQQSLLASVATPADGALILFIGQVREMNEGRPVSGLDYEAYAPMAEREMERIAAEASDRWAIGRVAIEHRTGALQIGDAAVAVAVAAPHRDPAYQASRYIIDEIKKRVPIWKRERYADGDLRWVDGVQPALP